MLAEQGVVSGTKREEILLRYTGRIPLQFERLAAALRFAGSIPELSPVVVE